MAAKRIVQLFTIAGNTITSLVSRMKAVETKVSKDYIVETGSNANWKWEKWNSGKAVCWSPKPVIVTADTVTALMGGYCGKISITLPFKFSQIETHVGGGRLGTGIGFFYGGVGLTNATAVNAWVCGNQDNKSVTYWCLIIGTWGG